MAKIVAESFDGEKEEALDEFKRGTVEWTQVSGVLISRPSYGSVRHLETPDRETRGEAPLRPA